MDKENRIKPKHHVAPKTGFLNDPNGLVQFKGTYHAFYQWLEEVTPQGAKCWRHCISKDLVHWEDKGIALEPDMWYDKMVAILEMELYLMKKFICFIQEM
ncbi:sucrose-6-phosphate hydrolase SacC (GH32 family) [Clostridium beijerinckii]|nr:sucrose-6-phosphate hydrolase SacC (GH32 family) [Clostridium beijerinckii]